MYNFENKLNKYILTEAFNWKNGEEVINAISNKQVGVKLNASFKEMDDGEKIFLKRDLDEYFSRCNKLNIKDTAYGIQFLLSHTTTRTISQAVKNDGLYEFLKSYKKPWVKELDVYKDFLSWQYDNDLWHNFEKVVQREQNNHGKVSKGSGNLQDVKVLYSDDEWWLGTPTSFNGEKAIAFYGKKGGTQTPCEWCTRADIEYYNMYTHNNKDPLYVFRNWKTGDSYQLAFMDDSVEFLDQFDSKGDDVSKGDLSKLPDNLLKLVKHPGGRTLLDYKNAPLDDNEKLKKNKKYTSNPAKGASDAVLGKPVELQNGVIKQEILNFSDEIDKKNAMSSFFSMPGGKYVTNKRIINYSKRAKATKYYLKGHQDAFLIYTATSKGGLDSCGIIQSKGYQDAGDDYASRVEDVADADFGKDKNLKRQEVGYAKENKIKMQLGSLNDKINASFFDNLSDKYASLLAPLGYNEIVGVNSSRAPIVARFKNNENSWDGPSDKLDHLYFLPMAIRFKKSDGSREDVTFFSHRPESCGAANKAYINYGTENKRLATPEEFKQLKKLGMTIGREIAKFPEWKELHQNYNNNRNHKNSKLYENYFNY